MAHKRRLSQDCYLRLPVSFTASSDDGLATAEIVTSLVTEDPIVAPDNTLTFAVIANTLPGPTLVVWYVPLTTAVVMFVEPLKYVTWYLGAAAPVAATLNLPPTGPSFWIETVNVMVLPRAADPMRVCMSPVVL